jgi:hypothetical protein
MGGSAISVEVQSTVLMGHEMINFHAKSYTQFEGL